MRLLLVARRWSRFTCHPVVGSITCHPAVGTITCHSAVGSITCHPVVGSITCHPAGGSCHLSPGGGLYHLLSGGRFVSLVTWMTMHLILRGSCRFAGGKIGIVWKFQLLLILIEDIVRSIKKQGFMIKIEPVACI